MWMLTFSSEHPVSSDVHIEMPCREIQRRQLPTSQGKRSGTDLLSWPQNEPTCPHIDLGLLAPRSHEMVTPCCLTTWSMVLWYSSSNRPSHRGLNEMAWCRGLQTICSQAGSRSGAHEAQDKGDQSPMFRRLGFVSGQWGGVQAFWPVGKVVTLGLRKLTLAAERRKLLRTPKQGMEFKGKGMAGRKRAALGMCGRPGHQDSQGLAGGDACISLCRAAITKHHTLGSINCRHIFSASPKARSPRSECPLG